MVSIRSGWLEFFYCNACVNKTGVHEVQTAYVQLVFAPRPALFFSFFPSFYNSIVKFPLTLISNAYIPSENLCTILERYGLTSAR